MKCNNSYKEFIDDETFDKMIENLISTIISDHEDSSFVESIERCDKFEVSYEDFDSIMERPFVKSSEIEYDSDDIVTFSVHLRSIWYHVEFFGVDSSDNVSNSLEYDTNICFDLTYMKDYIAKRVLIAAL